MALAGLACADAQPLDTTGYSISVFESNNGDHNNQKSSWDGCSPICVCHCCHVHFLSPAGVDFMHFVKLPAVHTSYFEDFNSIEIFGFLKPPMS